MSGSPYRTPARVEAPAEKRHVDAIEVRVRNGDSEALGWAYLGMVCVNVMFICWVVVTLGVAGVAIWFATSSLMLFTAAYHYRRMVDAIRIDAEGLTLVHRGGATTFAAAQNLPAWVRFVDAQPRSLHVHAHRWGVAGLEFEASQWPAVLSALEALLGRVPVDARPS